MMSPSWWMWSSHFLLVGQVVEPFRDCKSMVNGILRHTMIDDICKTNFSASLDKLFRYCLTLVFAGVVGPSGKVNDWNGHFDVWSVYECSLGLRL